MTVVAGVSFAVLVVLVLTGVGVAELRPDGAATRRVRRGLNVASASVTVLLVAALTMRVLAELP